MHKAIDGSLWTGGDEPRLIGSRCGACAATVFPAQRHCPACSAGEMSELPLPRRGTLIAWTTQGFPPGAPYAGAAGSPGTAGATILTR